MFSDELFFYECVVMYAKYARYDVQSKLIKMTSEEPNYDDCPKIYTFGKAIIQYRKMLGLDNLSYAQE